MGPDELDDLLKNTRAGGRNESALALYEGKGEEDLVDEDVDERILKLLGLDDVFDIDYGTYLTLLREKMAEARMVDKKLSTEETMLLTEEFKRVKGKVGRFKIKPKKITSDNIGVTGPIRVSSEKFYLTSKAIMPQPLLPQDGGGKDFKDITQALDEIIRSITDQNKQARKRAEESRKDDETKRRTKREAELEKPLKKAVALVKKLVSPFTSILDRIMNFIKFTLIGFFVDKVLKWFTDPANEKKIKLIGRFLKDWWPALLTAYGLFATPFGKFVRGTLKMLRAFIPQLVRFAAAHPLLAAGALTATATLGAEMWRQGEEKKQIEKEATKRNVKPEVVKKELEQSKRSPFAMFGDAMQNIGITGLSGGGRVKKRSLFGGGEIDARDIAFEGGGGIADDSGLRVTGAGPDTQLIAAQPGEIMMSKKAVDRYGANFFLGLNKNAGGTNIPRMVNNIQLAAGGGLIKRTIPTFKGGGMIGGNRPMQSMPATVSRPRFSAPNIKIGDAINNARQTIINRQGERNGRVNRNSSNVRPWWERLNPFRDNRSFSNRLPGPNDVKAYPRMPGFNRDVFNNDLIKQLNEPLRPYIKSGTASPLLTQSITPQINVGSPQYSSSGYSVNIRQAADFQPRGRLAPVGTPVIVSRTQTIVLPPQRIPAEKPSVPVKTGTQIPDVQTVAINPHRQLVTKSLGIFDLVGV